MDCVGYKGKCSHGATETVTLNPTQPIYSPIHKAAGSLVTGRSLQNGKMSMGNCHTERPPDPVLYGGRPSGDFVNRAVSAINKSQSQLYHVNKPLHQATATRLQFHWCKALMLPLTLGVNEQHHNVGIYFWAISLSGYHADTPITIKAEASSKADSRIH